MIAAKFLIIIIQKVLLISNFKIHYEKFLNSFLN